MIEISHIHKTFSEKGNRVEAVQDVSLHIAKGQIYGIIGNSGAGKSTLVRCLNLLEVPDSGEIRIGEQRLSMKNGKACHAETGAPLTEREQSRLRRSIGMIFQHFNLLDRSTVFENIAYPLRYTGMSRKEISDRVDELLALVNLQDKRGAYPAQLSGGQKQRVAIARALASHPQILLSDEATSALDPDATESILNLLRNLNEQLGLTIVLITHEMAVIKTIAERVAVMENGRVVEEGEVYDVFARPREEITKRFVASASALSRIQKLMDEDSPMVHTRPGDLLVKLTFTKESVGEAAISAISQKFGIAVNIVLASVEELRGVALGGLIAIFTGDPAQIQGAVSYLENSKVEVEVLRRG